MFCLGPSKTCLYKSVGFLIYTKKKADSKLTVVSDIDGKSKAPSSGDFRQPVDKIRNFAEAGLRLAAS